MAFLPGWDRARLLTAPAADVEGARLIAFATAVRPILARDLRGELAALERVDLPPHARENAEKAARREARTALGRAIRDQDRLRALLELDEDPDA